MIWERLAFVKGSYDIEAWRTSGLQNLKLWSDEDFIYYDEDRQKILNKEMTWNQFSSKHWNVDEGLRLDRYIHKYFNDENNLDFLEIEALIFDKDIYLSVINKLK